MEKNCHWLLISFHIFPTGQLKAHDPDDGLNAKIFYYLVSGNSHENFYLDKLHGKLYTNAVLDREQRASYTLVVKATNDPNFTIDPEQEVVYDPEDPTQAVVSLTVEDENDTPPRFHQDLYYAGKYLGSSFFAKFTLVCLVLSRLSFFPIHLSAEKRLLRITIIMCLQEYS